MNERGRSLDSVIEQYNKTVRPMFFQFIGLLNNMPILLYLEGENRVAIDILKAKIGQFCE